MADIIGLKIDLEGLDNAIAGLGKLKEETNSIRENLNTSTDRKGFNGGSFDARRAAIESDLKSSRQKLGDLKDTYNLPDFGSAFNESLNGIVSGIQSTIAQLGKIDFKNGTAETFSQINTMMGLVGARTAQVKQIISGLTDAFSGISPKDSVKINALAGSLKSIQQAASVQFNSKAGKQLDETAIARHVMSQNPAMMKALTGIGLTDAQARKYVESGVSATPHASTRSFYNTAQKFSGGVINPNAVSGMKTFREKLPDGYYDYIVKLSDASKRKEMPAYNGRGFSVAPQNRTGYRESVKMLGDNGRYGWNDVKKEAQTNPLLRQALVDVGLGRWAKGTSETRRTQGRDSLDFEVASGKGVTKLQAAQLYAQLARNGLPYIKGADMYGRDLINPDARTQRNIDRISNNGSNNLVSAARIVSSLLSSGNGQLDPVLLSSGDKNLGKFQGTFTSIGSPKIAPKPMQMQTPVYTVDDLLAGKSVSQLPDRNVANVRKTGGYIMKGESALTRMVNGNSVGHNGTQDNIILVNTSDKMLKTNSAGGLVIKQNGKGRGLAELSDDIGTWKDRVFTDAPIDINGGKYVLRNVNKSGQAQLVRKDRADAIRGVEFRNAIKAQSDYMAASMGLTSEEAFDRANSLFGYDAGTGKYAVDPLLNYVDTTKKYKDRLKVVEASNRLDTPTVQASKYGIAFGAEQAKNAGFLDESLLAAYDGANGKLKEHVMDGATLMLPEITGGRNFQARIGGIKTGISSWDYRKAIKDIYGSQYGIQEDGSAGKAFYMPRAGMSSADRERILQDAQLGDKSLGLQKLVELGVENGGISRNSVFDIMGVEDDIKAIISYGSAKSMRSLFNQEDENGTTENRVKSLLDQQLIFGTAMRQTGGLGIMESAASKRYGSDWLPAAAASRFGFTKDVLVELNNKAKDFYNKSFNSGEQGIIDYLFSDDSEQSKAVRANPELIHFDGDVKAKIEEAKSVFRDRMGRGDVYLPRNEASKYGIDSRFYEGAGAFQGLGEVLALAGRGTNIVGKEFADKLNLDFDESTGTNRIYTGKAGDNEEIAAFRFPYTMGENIVAANQLKRYGEMISRYGADSSALYTSSENMDFMGGGDWDVDTVNVIRGNVISNIKAQNERIRIAREEAAKKGIPEPEIQKTVEESGYINAEAMLLLAENAPRSVPLMASDYNTGEYTRQIDMTDPVNIRKYIRGISQSNSAYNKNSTFQKTGEYALMTNEMSKILSMHKPFQMGYKDILGAYLSRGNKDNEIMPQDLSQINFASLDDASAVLSLMNMQDFGLGSGVYQYLADKQMDVQKVFSGKTIREVLAANSGSSSLETKQAAMMKKIADIQSQQYTGQAQIVANKDVDEMSNLYLDFEKELATYESAGTLNAEQRDLARRAEKLAAAKIAFLKSKGATEENVSNGYGNADILVGNSPIVTGGRSKFIKTESGVSQIDTGDILVGELTPEELLVASLGYSEAQKTNNANVDAINRARRVDMLRNKSWSFSRTRPFSEYQFRNPNMPLGTVDDKWLGTKADAVAPFFGREVEETNVKDQWMRNLGLAAHETLQTWGNIRSIYDQQDRSSRSASDFAEWFKSADLSSLGIAEEGRGTLAEFLTGEYEKNRKKINVENSLNLADENGRKGAAEQIARTSAFFSNMTDEGIAGLLLDKNILGTEVGIRGSVATRNYGDVATAGIVDVLLQDRATGKGGIGDYKDHISGKALRDLGMTDIGITRDQLQELFYTGELNKILSNSEFFDENGIKEGANLPPQLYRALSAGGFKLGDTFSFIETIAHNSPMQNGGRIRHRDGIEDIISIATNDMAESIDRAITYGADIGYDPILAERAEQFEKIRNGSATSEDYREISKYLSSNGDLADARRYESAANQVRESEAYSRIGQMQDMEKAGENFALSNFRMQQYEEKRQGMQNIESDLFKERMRYEQPDRRYNKWEAMSSRLNSGFERDFGILEQLGVPKEYLQLLRAQNESAKSSFMDTLSVAATGDVQNAEKYIDNILSGSKDSAIVNRYNEQSGKLQSVLESSKNAYTQLEAEFNNQNMPLEAKIAANTELQKGYQKEIQEYDEKISAQDEIIERERAKVSEQQNKIDKARKDSTKEKYTQKRDEAQSRIEEAEAEKKRLEAEKVEKENAATANATDMAKAKEEQNSLKEKYSKPIEDARNAYANLASGKGAEASNLLFESAMQSISGKYGLDPLSSNSIARLSDQRLKAYSEIDTLKEAENRRYEEELKKSPDQSEALTKLRDERIRALDEQRILAENTYDTRRDQTQQRTLDSINQSSMYAKRSFYGSGFIGRAMSQADMNRRYYDSAKLSHTDLLNQQKAAMAEVEKAQKAYDEESARDSKSDKLKELGEKLSIAQGNSADISEQVNASAAALGQLASAANPANIAIANLANSFGRLSAQLGQRMFQRAIQEARQFVQQFDASMTEIQMITQKSDAEMVQVRQDTISKALNSRQSIASVSKVEADLYRQGLSDSDMNNRLDTILQFSTVAGIKVESATKIMTTAMQNGLVSSVQEAADAFVALGDNAATTAEEIAKAYQKVAATAANSDVTNSELMALITFGTSKTQLSGQQIGTALNTVFTRMRKVSSSNYIKDQNGNVTSINDVETALGTAGIKIRENNDTFRSTFEILKDVGMVWDELSDVQQSMITNAMAGTRQTNIFQTLMQAIGDDEGKTLEELIGLGENSDGITADKYAIAMQSLSAALTNVKNSFDSIIETFTNNGTITDILDGVAQFFQNLSGNAGDAAKSMSNFAIAIGPVAAILTSLGGAALAGAGLGPLGAIVGALSGAVGLGATALFGNIANNKAYNDPDAVAQRRADLYAKRSQEAYNKYQEYDEAKGYLETMQNSEKGSKEYNTAFDNLKNAMPDIASAISDASSSAGDLDAAISSQISSVNTLISAYGSLAAAEGEEAARINVKKAQKDLDESLGNSSTNSIFNMLNTNGMLTSLMNYALIGTTENNQFAVDNFMSILRGASNSAGFIPFLNNIYGMSNSLVDNGYSSQGLTSISMFGSGEALGEAIKNNELVDVDPMAIMQLFLQWAKYGQINKSGEFSLNDGARDFVGKGSQFYSTSSGAVNASRATGFFGEKTETYEPSAVENAYNDEFNNEMYDAMVDEVISNYGPAIFGYDTELTEQGKINLFDTIANETKEKFKGHVGDYKNTGTSSNYSANAIAAFITSTANDYKNDDEKVAQANRVAEKANETNKGFDLSKSVKSALSTAEGSKTNNNSNYYAEAMSLIELKNDYDRIQSSGNYEPGVTGRSFESYVEQVTKNNPEYQGKNYDKFFELFPMLAEAAAYGSDELFEGAVAQASGLTPYTNFVEDEFLRELMASTDPRSILESKEYTQRIAAFKNKYGEDANAIINAYETGSSTTDVQGLAEYQNILNAQATNRYKEAFIGNRNKDKIVSGMTTIDAGGTGAASYAAQAVKDLQQNRLATEAYNKWVRGEDLSKDEREALATYTGSDWNVLSNISIGDRRKSYQASGYRAKIAENNASLNAYEYYKNNGISNALTAAYDQIGVTIDKNGRANTENVTNGQLTWDQYMTVERAATSESSRRRMAMNAMTGNSAFMQQFAGVDETYRLLGEYGNESLMNDYLNRVISGQGNTTSNTLGALMSTAFGSNWMNTLTSGNLQGKLNEDGVFASLFSMFGGDSIFEGTSDGRKEWSTAIQEFRNKVIQESMQFGDYSEMANVYAGLNDSRAINRTAARSQLTQQMNAAQSARYALNNIDQGFDFSTIAGFLGLTEKEVSDIYNKGGGKSELEELMSEKVSDMQNGLKEVISKMLERTDIDLDSLLNGDTSMDDVTSALGDEASTIIDWLIGVIEGVELPEDNFSDAITKAAEQKQKEIRDANAIRELRRLSGSANEEQYRLERESGEAKGLSFDEWRKNQISQGAAAAGLDANALDGSIAYLLDAGLSNSALQEYLDYAQTGNITESRNVTDRLRELQSIFKNEQGQGLYSAMNSKNRTPEQQLYDYMLMQQFPELSKASAMMEAGNVDAANTLYSNGFTSANVKRVTEVKENRLYGQRGIDIYSGLTGDAEKRAKTSSDVAGEIIQIADTKNALNSGAKVSKKDYSKGNMKSITGVDYEDYIANPSMYQGQIDTANSNLTANLSEITSSVIASMNNYLQNDPNVKINDKFFDGMTGYDIGYNGSIEGLPPELISLIQLIGSVSGGEEALKALQFDTATLGEDYGNGPNSIVAANRDMYGNPVGSQYDYILSENDVEGSVGSIGTLQDIYNRTEELAGRVNNGESLTGDEANELLRNVDLLSQYADEIEKAQNATEDLNDQQEDLVDTQGELSDSTDNAGEALNDFSDAGEEAEETNSNLTDSFDDLAESAEDGGDAVQDTSISIEGSVDEIDNSGVEDALADATATAAENAQEIADANSQDQTIVAHTNFTVVEQGTVTADNAQLQSAVSVFNSAMQGWQALASAYQAVKIHLGLNVNGNANGVDVTPDVDVNIPTATVPTGGGGSKGGGGGGGGGGKKKKSAAEKLLEKIKRDDESYKHDFEMNEILADNYKDKGDLRSYGIMLEERGGLMANRQTELAMQMRKIENMMNSKKVKYASEDWYDLQKQLRSAEEEYNKLSGQIQKNTDELEKNRRETNKTKIEVEDLLRSAFEDEEEYRKSKLEGQIEIENEILDAIKQRYQKEWDLIREDIKKKKEALNDEMALIDERLNRRKKANSLDAKYEELSNLQYQLSMISSDSSRTREQKELRKKIEDITKEIADSNAESVAAYEKDLLEQQSKAYDEYTEESEKDFDEYMKNANNFANEIADILKGSASDIISWLQNNNEEFANSLKSTQQKITESWGDTIDQWKGNAKTYNDQIAQYVDLSDKESYINGRVGAYTAAGLSDTDARRQLEQEYFGIKENAFVNTMASKSNEYREGTAAQKQELEAGWREAFKQYTGANMLYGIQATEHSNSPITTNNDDTIWKISKSVSMYSQYGNNGKVLATLPSGTIQGTGNNQMLVLGGTSETDEYLKILYNGKTGYIKKSGHTTRVLKATENYGYRDGGIVDYTGLATVHGTPLRPEAFLDADDTRVMREFLETAKVLKYQPTISNVSEESFKGNSTTIGDVNVVINEAEINTEDDYSYIAERVGQEIMKNMSQIGVNVAKYSW